MRAVAAFSACTLVALTACAPAPVEDATRTSSVWPAQVVQSMPANIPDDAVLRDTDGCYGYRDPTALTGYQLIIGIDGRQVCDGRFADPVEIAALAAAARARIVAGDTNIGDVAP